MPEQRMSAQLARLAKKRGRLPALVTALGLALVVSLQFFLGSLFSHLGSLGVAAVAPPTAGLLELTTNQYQFQPTPEQLLFFTLPLALGVFLGLWLIAPISDELSLRFVLTRAGLASAVGVVLVIVFQTVQGFVEAFGAASNVFAGAEPSEAPPAGFQLSVFAQNTIAAATGGLSTFVFYTPLVMLAGVLLWLWLRDHPRDYAVAGLIDEV